MQIFTNNSTTWTSNRFILKRWPWDVGTGMETKALEQKRKWRCSSTRQHNQFQVTFYINDRQSWMSARVQGCQPVWPTRLFAPPRPKRKRRAPFFLEKCPVVCANLENLFLQRAGLDFDPDLSPSWQWINNKKRLARESRLRLGLKPGRSTELIVRLEDSVVT